MTLSKKTAFITFLIFALLSKSEITYANTEFSPDIYWDIPLSSSNIPSDVIITKISKDGPAYNAGMKINDKIVSIDGKNVKSALNAFEFIKNSKSEIIEIIVLRNNQEVKLNVRPLIIGYGSEGDILMSGKKTKKRRIGVNWLSACSNPGDWKKNKNECWIDFKSRQLDYLNTLTKSSQYYNDYISYKTEALMSLGYHEIKRKNFSNAINFYESAYNLAVEIDDIIQSTKITSIVSWMGQKEKVAYTLGELYLNVGGVRDYDKAVKYLTIASEDVYKAWRDLGLMYLEGRGVKLDEKKAFELLKKSSTHGSGFEHVYVGDFYLLGLGGQKKNLSKALRHFKLAELGSRGTVNFSNIEVLYKYKRLPQNSDEFYSWLLENIEKNSNSVPSMERLGYFSNTILKNYPEAYKWYYICSKAEFNEEEIFVGQANIEVPEIKKRCFNKLDILETDYLSNYNMEQAKIAADKWTNKYMN